MECSPARSISLDLSSEAFKLIADIGFDPQFGARHLRGVGQQLLQDPLSTSTLECGILKAIIQYNFADINSKSQYDNPELTTVGDKSD